MHSINISQWGQTPRYTSADPPAVPASNSSEVQITVHAAAGQHYSAKTLPHVPGFDGIGLNVIGSRIYFNSMQTGGSMT